MIRSKARRVAWQKRRLEMLTLAIGVGMLSTTSLADEPNQRDEFARLIAQGDGPIEADAIGVAPEPLPTSSMVTTEAVTECRLEQLEQLALLNNPSIARLAALINAARGNALQVGLPPNPETGYSGQQIGSQGRAEQHGVVLNQEWVVRDKLRLNRAVAAADVRRLENEFAAQRQRVLTDVRVAFVEALRAKQQLMVATELETISIQARDSANALFQASEVSKIDVLQAEIEVENASILKRNSENRLSAAYTRLNAITGRMDSTPLNLVGDLRADLREVDFELVLDQILQSSPEISVVLARLERSRANLSRQIVEPRPNVMVQGVYNWRDNGINGDPDGMLQVSLPIPIWNRNQGAIREARNQIAAAERELTQVELDLQSRLAPVYEQYANSIEQVRRFDTAILPKAEETLALTREAYQQGELSFINLLTVQRTNAQSRIAYLDAIESLRIAEIQMEGLLLDGSLGSRPE